MGPVVPRVTGFPGNGHTVVFQAPFPFFVMSASLPRPICLNFQAKLEKLGSHLHTAVHGLLYMGLPLSGKIYGFNLQ